MATLLSLTSVGIGDVDLFMPSPPCLVVNTFYVDGEAESSVTYLWQDAESGELKSELVYMQPVSFETALAWAEEHALTRSVERIHTRHAPKAEPKPAPTAPKRRPARKAVAKRKAAPKKAQRKAAPEAGAETGPRRSRGRRRRNGARPGDAANSAQRSGQGNRNACGVAW